MARRIDSSDAIPLEERPQSGEETKESGLVQRGSDELSSRRASSHARQRGRSPERRLDKIARRAYEIYEARGGEHGRDMDDWLRAEREIDGE
ncbi:MAG: DUF2934 domain-containing protein [Vicinamibacterales bacterium]